MKLKRFEKENCGGFDIFKKKTKTDMEEKKKKMMLNDKIK